MTVDQITRESFEKAWRKLGEIERGRGDRIRAFSKRMNELASAAITIADYCAMPGVRRVREGPGQFCITVRVGWWRWLWRPALRRIRKTIETRRAAHLRVRVGPWWW